MWAPFYLVLFILVSLGQVWAGNLDHLRQVSFTHLTTQEGLSQDSVYHIIQDRMGFLWFATRDGLCRYDGGRFKIYYHDFDNPDSLPGNQLHGLIEDRQGNIWVGTSELGVSRFDPKTESFTNFYHDERDPTSLSYNSINSLCEDKRGNIWIGTDFGLNLYDPKINGFRRWSRGDGPPNLPGNQILSMGTMERDPDGLWIGTNSGLCRYDLNQQTFRRFKIDAKDPASLDHPFVYAIEDGLDGTLWVATLTGLNRLDIASGKFRRYNFDLDEKDGPINVSSLELDHNKLLWLGTSHGLLVVDPETGEYVHHAADAGDQRSLNSNSIVSVFEDQEHIIWAGTFSKGLNKYNRASEQIETFVPDPSQPPGFTVNSAMAMYEDPSGMVYVGGLVDGFYRFDPNGKRSFKIFYYSDYKDKGMIGDTIYAIAPFEDVIWMGGSRGLMSFDPENERFERLECDGVPEDNLLASVTSIWKETEDRTWVGLRNGGLALRVPGQPFQYVSSKDGLSSDDINAIAPAAQGGLVLGMVSTGIDHYQPETGKVVNHDLKGNANSSPHVLTVLTDKQGGLWVGTLSGGLLKVDLDTGNFRRYTRRDGLVNEKIFAMTECKKGRLWIGTNRGISRFDPDTERFKNFGLWENIQANEFGKNSGITLRDGTVLLGGIGGVNIIDPSRIKDSMFAPDVVFTDFTLMNEPTNLVDNIAFADRLELSYKDSFIGLKFSALNFIAPYKNLYQYQMDGLNQEWVSLGNRYDITFPKLAPGSYTLRIKASNHEGVWSDKTLDLPILVNPPWWQTQSAYISYVLLTILLIMGVAIFLRHKFQRERAINERLRQVDRLKDEFLANTSHELRTPLHGMIGIAESLLAGAAGEPTSGMAENLRLMISSGKRLEHLVSDILDFSKMKQHSLELRQQPVDLATMVKVVLTICGPLAREKGLELTQEPLTNIPLLSGDEDRLQQILYNLVGNAVKFTESGTVRVSATVEGDMVRISVSDTGIGFDQAQTDLLFESFRQVDGGMARQYGGTGLGLAITRELVSLHGGTIQANASPGRGATFSFTIPVYEGELEHSDVVSDHPTREFPELSISGSVAVESELAVDDDGSVALAEPREQRQRHILAVDDEPANRQILRNLLSLNDYKITLAANGQEALDMVDKDGPFDLVLLDVMMPKLSGFDVCRMLRKRYQLPELPIIFLTAKSQVADLVTGFDLGANDYLTKPFSKDELLSRVRPHLELMDINRNLEQKIQERTDTLRSYNEELETFDSIVRTINRELEPESLLPALLEQGLSLFPQAHRGIIYLWDGGKKGFVVASKLGFFEKSLQMVTYGDALRDYINPTDSLGIGLDVIPFEKRPGETVWILSMIMEKDSRPEGFLILETQVDPHGFSEPEIGRLLRFREHAVAAMARARMLKELSDKQKELVLAAHMVGVSENATMVLHHMGNSLNSVHTSVEVLQRSIATGQWFRLADRILTLSKDNEEFTRFVQDADNRKQFHDVLNSLFERLKGRDKSLNEEMERLEMHVSNMLTVLREQRDQSDVKEIPEEIDLNKLIQNAIYTEQLSDQEQNVKYVENFSKLPQVRLPKIRFIRLLSHLFSHARRAIEARDHVEGGTITIRTAMKGETVVIEIGDDGIGVAKERITELFDQNHGTMHYCANVMKELGGQILLNSEGEGKGELVTLSLPVFKEELN